MAGDAPFGERDGQGPSRPSSRKSQLQSANRKQDEDEKARASRLEQEHGALFEEKARALGGVEDDETAALAAKIIATRIAQKGIEYEQMAAKDVTRLVVQSVGEAYRIQDLESERAKAPGVEAARTESASADYKPAAKEVTGRTEGPPPHSSDRSAPNGPAGSPDQSPSSPAGTRGAQAAAPDNGREAGEEFGKAGSSPPYRSARRAGAHLEGSWGQAGRRISCAWGRRRRDVSASRGCLCHERCRTRPRTRGRSAISTGH